MNIIEIEEPIWKDRTVGLNIQGYSDSAEVGVRISYVEKKTGKLLYPGTFKMKVKEIRAYPTQEVKGIKLHLVPINDLLPHKVETDEPYNPKVDYSVVDNWDCASKLDKFNSRFIQPLSQRVDKGWEFIMNTKIPAEKRSKYKPTYERMRIQLDEYKTIYEAAVTLMRRHENLVNELARHYVNIQESIVDKEGSFPKELFDEQVELLNDYYNTMKNLLKPCNLEDLI